MKKKLVLVVEDNDLNRRLFNDILKVHGFATIEARDGVEALATLAHTRPDLILLDIQLPGISGLEVARTIKGNATLASIPILAVTAFAMKNDEERIRASGCDGYVSKPISIKPFVAVVNQFVA